MKASVKLKWKQGKFMPFTMSGPQTVIIGSNIYVGGGYHDKQINSGTVMGVFS